jgi:hypothetical protein
LAHSTSVNIEYVRFLKATTKTPLCMPLFRRRKTGALPASPLAYRHKSYISGAALQGAMSVSVVGPDGLRSANSASLSPERNMREVQ